MLSLCHNVKFNAPVAQCYLEELWIRRAFNQVRVLDRHQYWNAGMIGLDVKAIRTQPTSIATKHLRNSMHAFLRLVEVARSIDQKAVNALIAERDYEELDWLVLNSLMGR